MNKKKDFLRLTIVLSILSWAVIFFFLWVKGRNYGGPLFEDFIIVLILSFIAGVTPIWLIYFVIRFIVSRFKSKDNP
jgi:hypothetical protein